MKKAIYYVMFIISILCSAPAFGAVPGYLSRYETNYQIYDLGLMEGGSTSIAYSVNNNMMVAGDAANGTGMQHAFVSSGSGLNLIAGTSGYSKVKGINDAGQVVGYRDVGGGKTEAYLYQNGSMQSLGGLGVSSYAYGMNNWGQVVGSYKTSTGDTLAFLYDGIDLQSMGTLGGNSSIAKDINELGGATGYSTTTSGYDHAFRYGAGIGRMEDIGTLGGDNSYGNAINRYGHTVGYSETASGGDSHAFYYDGDTMRDMGTLGGDNSFANNINEFGFVVGYSETADGKNHAFVYHQEAFWYEGATIIDLNDFISGDSEWESITNAYDINEWGQIVGVGVIDGQMHAFLMNPDGLEYSPVPLPGTSMLLGSCITLLAALKRRRG
jgi:probable HAF family extracellular repeat protein